MRFAACLYGGLLAATIAPAIAGPACADLEQAVDATPQGPVLLASYPTVKEGPLKGTAFVYDNAAAIIALVGCGAPDKARRIGDALLIAMKHDPFWHDGRLRNAYAAGVVEGGADRNSAGKAAVVKTAGWWDGKQKKWVEDPYMTASDSGNLAWAALALMTLDRVTVKTAGGKAAVRSENLRYLRGAERLGGWLLTRFDGEGFSGGFLGFEPHPQALTWKSVEHNTDLAALYWQLAARTNGHKWRLAAERAGAFVNKMWNFGGHRYDAGSDLGVRDTTLALDAQVWPMLALHSAHPVKLGALAYADGYSYGAARGVWTEGTAQVALLRAGEGDRDDYAKLMAALEKRRSPGGFYRASDKDLSTGFRLAADPAQQRQFFPLPHLGATAWVALADTRYNPFMNTVAVAP